jgi:hypothetical protein
LNTSIKFTMPHTGVHMQTSKAPRKNGARQSSNRNQRSSEPAKKSKKIDVVWVLLLVLLVLGVLLTVGIFYAMIHPTGGV